MVVEERKGTKVGGERESRYRRVLWWMAGVSTGAWRRAGVKSTGGKCITIAVKAGSPGG
jgi:hypothetical protein